MIHMLNKEVANGSIVAQIGNRNDSYVEQGGGNGSIVAQIGNRNDSYVEQGGDKWKYCSSNR